MQSPTIDEYKRAVIARDELLAKSLVLPLVIQRDRQDFTPAEYTRLELVCRADNLLKVNNGLFGKRNKAHKEYLARLGPLCIDRTEEQIRKMSKEEFEKAVLERLSTV